MAVKKVLSELKQLYDKYYILLCIYASNILGDLEEAKDVVQDVFISFLDKPIKGKTEAEKKSYLYKSVRNACLNVIDSKSRKEKRLDELKRLEETTNEPQLPDADEKIRLYNAIESLPEKTRQVFIKVHVNGCKYDEAAEDLDISKNTVKTQLARAIRLLREKLDIKISE